MKLQVIDRGYARIYIDIDGYCLKGKEAMEEFMDKHIIEDYHNVDTEKHPGIQWNFYLLVLNKDNLREAEYRWLLDESHYCRKFMISPEKVEGFVNDYFPEVNPENTGTFTLITGDNDIESYNKYITFSKGFKGVATPSFHARENSLRSLRSLDGLRKLVLEGSNGCIYTHIEHEISWVRYKFRFLGEKYNEI